MMKLNEYVIYIVGRNDDEINIIDYDDAVDDAVDDDDDEDEEEEEEEEEEEDFNYK